MIISERINPTGRKQLAAEDYSRVEADAVAQVEAGAQVLDVDAVIPLAEAVRLAQAITDVPFSLDSSIVAAVEAGLEACEGKSLDQLGDRRGRKAGSHPAAV